MAIKIKLPFFSLICILLLFSCNETNNVSHTTVVDKAEGKTTEPEPDSNLAKAGKEWKIVDSTKGDYNGDGKQEYAWLVPPEILEDDSCVGGCNSLIKFSDASIPPIMVERCIDGHPDNLGDLNKDKGDEVGISTQWFMGCWNSYNAYTLKDGKWIYAVEPFPTHCNQWDEVPIPIKTDPNKPGYVIITYSKSTDKSIEIRTKAVRVK